MNALIHGFIRQHIDIFAVHAGRFSYFQLFQIAAQSCLCQGETFFSQRLKHLLLTTEFSA